MEFKVDLSIEGSRVHNISHEVETESQSKGPQFMIRADGVGSLHQNKEKTNDFHNSLFSLSSVKGGEAKTKFFISIFVKQTNY